MKGLKDPVVTIHALLLSQKFPVSGALWQFMLFLNPGQYLFSFVVKNDLLITNLWIVSQWHNVYFTSGISANEISQLNDCVRHWSATIAAFKASCVSEGKRPIMHKFSHCIWYSSFIDVNIRLSSDLINVMRLGRTHMSEYHLFGWLEIFV
jgi:hypothetical protein